MAGDEPRMPVPGDTLLGKYRLVRFLGKGGVGVVFEAEHVRLRQRVALKMLSRDMLRSPEMVGRFEREARAMALLASPHVTRVLDVDAADGVPFLVMEFLQGQDLHAEIKARKRLPVAEAVEWVRQACAGMAVVHAAGIVHRDLKPANLFLAEGPEGRTLKIMDFGVSKILGDDVEVTSTIATLGTPAYMAPEQVRCARDIDARADVWALGVILYRALTGKTPFQGQGTTGMAVAIVNDEPHPLEQLRPEVPVALLAVVRRALAKDPAARYPSVGALSDALSDALSGGIGAGVSTSEVLAGPGHPVRAPVPSGTSRADDAADTREITEPPPTGPTGASIAAQSVAVAQTQPASRRREGRIVAALLAVAGVVVVAAAVGRLVASRPAPAPAAPRGDEPPARPFVETATPAQPAESAPPVAAQSIARPAESAPVTAASTATAPPTRAPVAPSKPTQPPKGSTKASPTQPSKPTPKATPPSGANPSPGPAATAMPVLL